MSTGKPQVSGVVCRRINDRSNSDGSNKHEAPYFYRNSHTFGNIPEGALNDLHLGDNRTFYTEPTDEGSYYHEKVFSVGADRM